MPLPPDDDGTPVASQPGSRIPAWSGHWAVGLPEDGNLTSRRCADLGPWALLTWHGKLERLQMPRHPLAMHGIRPRQLFTDQPADRVLCRGRRCQVVVGSSRQSGWCQLAERGWSLNSAASCGCCSCSLIWRVVQQLFRKRAGTHATVATACSFAGAVMKASIITPSESVNCHLTHVRSDFYTLASTTLCASFCRPLLPAIKRQPALPWRQAA